MPAQTFEAAATGGTLAGHREGAGPAALVLHGGPGLSDYMDGLVPEVAGFLDTIRYQQRGLAPSMLDGPFTVEQHVADAVAVLDALGIERAFAVGHSWGGHLAMHLAVARPERLLGLAVIDPLGAVGDGGEAAFVAELTARTPPESVERAAELDRRALAGEGSEAEAVESLALFWPAYFAIPATAPPFPALRLSVPAYSATFESIHRHLDARTLERGLADCPLPAVFVHGEADPMPVSASADSAALMPRARVVAVSGCGHFPWLEAPGTAAAAVRDLVEAAV